MQAIFDFPLLLLILLLPIRTASLGIHGIEEDDEISWKRRTDFDDAIRQKLVHQTPVGVRKLSDDDGEKFWLDYWQFLDDIASVEDEDAVEISDPNSSNNDAPDTIGDIWQNASLLQAPYALHGHDLQQSRPRWLPRGLLSSLAKRSFECPVGSSPCTSIDRPNSCCWKGSVCQIIEDTGLGDVGCCPGDSDACDGGLDSCPEGHTSCPENPGGGCCIPGYSCFEAGCISTVTVTVTPTAAPTSTSTSTPPPSTATTTVTEPPPVDPPWRPTANPDTSIPTPTSTSTTEPTTTEPTTTEPPTIPTDIGCPTGFYACSAAYDGGCCRIGRDCQPTSCAAPSMTTVVDSDGATIVVPIETGSSSWSTAPTGRCADGWMSCASDDGGGCCPDGYGCGWTSCTASASVGTGSVGKRPPENAGGRGALAEWKFAVAVWMVVVLWQLGW